MCSDHKESNETSEFSDLFDHSDQKVTRGMLASSEPSDLVERGVREANSDRKDCQVQRESVGKDDSPDHNDSHDLKASLDHNDQQEVAREICSNQRILQGSRM